MRAVWRIELLGGLGARLGERTVSRFRTQKTAALFAYLAYHRHRSHPREMLIELFWPEAEPESGRHSLSLALSSLRNQLEPPGIEAGGVVVADRWSVELNPEAFTTDVGDFEAALRLSAQAREESGKIRHLSEALECYCGRLLPGFYEDWALLEQERLVERHLQALRQLTDLLETAGEHERAVDVARRGVQAEPLREEAHLTLMRLHSGAGQFAAALRQFRELERILDQDLAEEPSREARELARRIEVQQQRQSTNEPEARSPTSRRETPALRTAAIPAIPVGTVTFLLTDIEGSTARWEREGEQFREVLTTHHTLLRREFHRHGGHEVQEGGDSFLIAFAAASDALACAVAAQRLLEADDWGALEPVPVRMALHSGDVEVRDGEYRGVALHRAARILSAAHGGQVVCSEATSSLLRRDLETEVHLRDLGVYRLRDVEQPERLFQAEFAGMTRREFPALRAERAHAGNLPLQFTRFFGREKELSTLEALLLDLSVRLVTMTGPGGTGKSRLAVEAAGRLVDSFAGRVWFVPLAELSDPGLVASAILQAMGLEPGEREPLEQVAAAFSGGRTLLLLDNYEQLVGARVEGTPERAGEDVVLALLERVPGVTCLVTSRQLLGLPGEREYPVPPLAIPGEGGTPEAMGIFESVRLFVDRAQAVKPDFQVTNTNAPAVAELCNRLEGIPLAIELAAARAQVLSPAQMLQQLGGGPGGRFDLLVTRKRGVVERQRALRSTVDWSYRLLSPPLQEFFQRLSVFRGGWSTEAAEAVCNVGASSLVGPALDHLAQLRESSLVLTEEGPDGIRFRMLETLRDFAGEKLAESGAAGARQRHARYFLDLAELGERELRGENQMLWLNRLQAEHDNFRAAIDGGMRNADSGVAVADRFCSALWYFWSIRGHMTEGRRIIAQVLSSMSPDKAASERAGLLLAAGVLAHDQSDFVEAETSLRECVALRRTGTDSASLAHAINCLANVMLDGDRPDEALPLYQEALGLCREAGDQRGASIALSNLGVLYEQRGEFDRAAELLSESVRLKRKLGNSYGLANSLDSVGNVEKALGRIADARTHYEEALALRRELGHKQGIGISLNNLGVLLLEWGDPPAAVAHFREALTLFEELQEPRGLAEAVEGLSRADPSAPKLPSSA